MRITLVLHDALFAEASEAAHNDVESAGVLLTSVVHDPDGNVRLLGRRIIWVPESAYSQRAADGMQIASEGYVPALSEAEKQGATPIWVHTHPGKCASPQPSDHDRRVDVQISSLFRQRSGAHYYGAVIFSPREIGMAFAGHITRDGDERHPIERLWVVGTRCRLLYSDDSDLPELSPIFDRSVRAFGSAVQQTLGSLHIGLVGCGGTGSAVAEQLVRLGVRQLTLIDPDVLSASNVTRVYGSSPDQVGRSKADMLTDHITRIAPDGVWTAVKSMVTTERAARQLTACDFVFGCTDDNAGRLVLSRIPTYLLTPVIDCGVLISSEDRSGEIIGIDGRVTTVTPASACLVCRDRIDLARASSELLTPEERIRLETEGYAAALGRTEPAVVTFTTAVAAAAVTELLELLTGFGPEPRPTEVLLRFHDRDISTNSATPRERHYCHPSSGKLGAGITEPFLGLTWPN